MRVLRTLASRRSALVRGPLVLASLSAGVLLPASAAQAQETCVSLCLPTAADRPSSDPLRPLTSYLSLAPAALLSPSPDDAGDDVAEQAAKAARLAARRAAAEQAAAQRAAAERAAAAAAAAERATAERATAERAAAAAAAERAAVERAAAAAAERATAERATAERATAERAAAAAAERTAADQVAVERTQTGVPTPSPLRSPLTGPSPAQEGRTRTDPGLALQAPAATNGPATGPLAPAPSDGQPETSKQAGSNEPPLAGLSGGAARPDDAAGAQGDGAASSGDAGSSTTAGSTAAESTAPRATTGPSAATQPQSGQTASASTDTTSSRSVPLVTALIGGVLALLVLIVREIVR